jgi:hypothetical protein
VTTAIRPAPIAPPQSPRSALPSRHSPADLAAHPTIVFPDSRRTARRDGALLLATLIILAAAAKPILFDTLDPDLFWHLRIADTIAHLGVRPIVDNLSFNSIRTPWVPYSWLAELTMKAVWDWAGWRGTIALQSFLLSAWTLLLILSSYEMVRQYDAAEDAPLIRRDAGMRCCIVAAGALFLSLPYLSFRPSTFAWILIAAVALLVLRDRRRPSGLVWLAVPLTAVCANVHLLVCTIPVWPLCLLVEDLMLARTWRRHALLLLFVCTAALATPLLPGAVASAWHYQFADVMVANPARSGIADLQSIFRGAGLVVWPALLTCLLGGAALARRRLGWAPLLGLAFATALLIRLSRFAPFYAIAAAPVAAALLRGLSDRVLARGVVRAALAIVLAAIIVRIAAQFPRPTADLSTWLNRHGPGTPGYPCAAADFVSQLPISPSHSPRLINDYSWGGYLEWRLPQYQVFMDARTQLFPPQFWFATILGDKQQCAQTVAATTADAAILPLARADWRDALLARGWHIAYHDDRAIVLLPPTIRRYIND